MLGNRLLNACVDVTDPLFKRYVNRKCCKQVFMYFLFMIDLPISVSDKAIPIEYKNQVLRKKESLDTPCIKDPGKRKFSYFI